MRHLHNVRTLLGGVIGGLLVLAAIGCSQSGAGNPPKSGGDTPDISNQRPRNNRVQPTQDTPVNALPGAAAADGEWGTIKGQVVFGGDKVPTPVVLTVTKDQKECLETKKQLTSEDWVVDPETKGLKWAIVWLIPDSRKKEDLTKPIPINPKLKGKNLQGKSLDENIVIDQPCCMFEPYCIALQEGQKVTIKNSMTISHNSKIDSDDPQTTKNPIIPPGEKVEIGPFKAQWSEIPLSCSIHSWMSGHMRVFPHPYFVVTGKDGKFEIKDAPTGKFRLVIWHPGGLFVTHEEGKDPDKFGMPIEIKGGTTTDLGQFKVMIPK